MREYGGKSRRWWPREAATERGKPTKANGLFAVGDIDERRKLWREVARGALDGKRQRISISIPERALARLKARAAEDGMPYQALINSILHKYVEG